MHTDDSACVGKAKAYHRLGSLLHDTRRFACDCRLKSSALRPSLIGMKKRLGLILVEGIHSKE
jgi:hypothetical protein